MASAVKRKLSASTDGKPILIEATSANGTLIHTAVSGTTAGTFDEIWLWAYNSDSSAVELTIEFGEESGETTDEIKVSIAAQSGLVPILPGLILQNDRELRAYASTASKITLVGFVNSITD